MTAKPASRSAQVPPDALAQVRDLLDKALQFAAWIGAALEHRAEFPPRVVLAVVQDYLGQYEALSPDLRSSALEASQARRALSEQVVELDAVAREVDGRVDELRLRHIIGEFGKEDFTRREKETRSRVDGAALPAARASMEQIDEVLAAVGGVQARIAEYGRQLTMMEGRDVPPPPPPSAVLAPTAVSSPGEVAPSVALSVAPQIYHASITAPAATAVPSSVVSPADPAGSRRPGEVDELGEEAYRAGGAVEDEWDVGQAGGPPVQPAQVEQDTPPGGWGGDPGHTGSQDLLATGMINARPDVLAGANALTSSSQPAAADPPIPAPPHNIIVPGEGPRLLVFPPDAPEQLYPFGGEVMSLGRGRNNDVQIKNDGKISRYHCRIFRRGDEFIIEDNKSSNGTMVDGKLVTRQRLDGGEQVQIGETRVIFQV